MPPARAPGRQRPSFPGYQATAGTRAERAVLDALPGHPLARHIDDFLTDLANANRPRNTIRAYRGDLIAFAAAGAGIGIHQLRHARGRTPMTEPRARPATPGKTSVRSR